MSNAPRRSCSNNKLSQANTKNYNARKGACRILFFTTTEGKHRVGRRYAPPGFFCSAAIIKAVIQETARHVREFTGFQPRSSQLPPWFGHLRGRHRRGRSP